MKPHQSVELSIVVPTYKEENNVDNFVSAVSKILKPITQDYEIIFALDPSPDRTEQVIAKHNQADPRIKLVKFSRRFGQAMSTIGGLQYSTGRAVIVMDIDMQDPPELILSMVEKWKEGFDVVYAQRKHRHGETLLKRFVSYMGYKVINRIAEVDIPRNTGDFRLMSRRVVEELLALKESHGFLRGLVSIVGFKQTAVLFDRPARFAGQGNYNRFLGSLRVGMNGVVCFSNYLLSMSTVFGFMVATFSFLMGIAYFFAKVMGVGFPMGNPTIVILILFLGGVQLISVGILGEYIGRIYDEVKQRPKFIVESAIGFAEQSPPLAERAPGAPRLA